MTDWLASRKILFILLSMLLFACSNNGYSPAQSSGSVTTIRLTQAIIPSLPERTSTSYLSVVNTGNQVVSGLTYTASESAVIIPEGQCSTLMPGQTCALKLNVSAQTNAFTTISIGQRGNNTSNSQILAINQVTYRPQLSGVGAVGLLLPSSVQADESSITASVVVNAVVIGNSDGIESINLNYANWQLLKTASLQANNIKTLGGNSTKYHTGDIVSFLITMPVMSSTTVALAPVVTSLINSNLTVVTGNSLPLRLVMANSGGTLAFYPQQLALTNNSPDFRAEIINNASAGSGNLTIFNILNSLSAIKISADTCSGHILAPGEHCSYLVSLESQITISGSGALTVNYSSGNSGLIAVNQIVDFHVSGAPGIAVFDTGNFNFITTEQTPVTHEIYLTNSGEQALTDINFTLPTGFSLAPALFGGTISPCSIVGQQIAQLLPGASCRLLLTYDGANTQDNTNNGVLVTNFNYGGNKSASISQNLIYTTIPMATILTLSPSEFVYPNIKANQQESAIMAFSLTNIGSAPTSSININSSLNVFQLLNNDCPAVLNSGKSCSFNIKFGPTLESMTFNGQINVQYQSGLPGGGTGVVANYLSGTSYALNGADISLGDLTISPNPVSGTGKTAADAYQVVANNLYQVTLTYLNLAINSATNFTIDTTALSNQYTVNSNNCSGVTLARGGSCNLVLTVNTSATGSNNLLLNSLVASWSDSSGNHVVRLPWGNQYMMYLNVDYLAPSLSFNPESVQVVLKANNTEVQSANFVVSNNGDYQASLGSPILSPALTWGVINNDCGNVLNPAESCMITVSLGPTTIVTSGILKLSLPFSGGSAGESEITASINYQTISSIIAQIQSGYFQGAGLDLTGHAWWWGWVVGGTTPVPCTDCGGAYLIPSRVMSNLNFSLLSGQYANDCGLVNLSGSAYCWGNGKYGALGNNSTANSVTPVAVSGGNTYSQISTGYRSSCAIDLNSNLWCWGQNAQGQLGNGNFTSSSIPVASASGNFKSVSAGYNFTCALKSDNSAWCFGDNEAGQLGNGSALPCANSSDCSSSYVGTPVGHACAIDNNQDMYCWGSNTSGQLGGGSVSSCTSANPSSCTATPQKVIGGHKFISLTAGAGYSCGIDTAHHAWCWGQNQNGQLGIGNLTSPVLTPTAVSGNLEFTQLSGSFTANTCGMDINGKSWCWGSNICGQLGFTSNMTLNYCVGGTAPSEFPYQVSIPTLVNESGYF